VDQAHLSHAKTVEPLFASSVIAPSRPETLLLQAIQLKVGTAREISIDLMQVIRGEQIISSYPISE
jgi:hypothetical protein